MPEPPGIIKRVNYVKNFIVDPCEAPFIVYVETFLPAFGKLVLNWYSFGLDDIIRGYFRPAGLVSMGHRRRLPDRKKARKRNKLVRALEEIIGFEPGEVIAKYLPFQQKMSYRMISQGERYLWIIDGIVQRALYYWMVVDLVTEFAYEWTSLLMRTEYCEASTQYFLHTHCPEQFASGYPGIHRIYVGDVVKQRGAVLAGVIDVFLPYAGTVVAAGRLEPYSPKDFPPITGQIVLWEERDHEEVEIGRSGIFTDTTDKEKGAVARGTAQGYRVMPRLHVYGQQDEFYASWLRDFTLTAFGGRG